MPQHQHHHHGRRKPTALSFTSESVSAGHPDKVADQISDAILDAFLARDPLARVACETLVADGLIVLAGEFRTSRAVFREVRAAAPGLVRRVLREIGYRSRREDPDTGCDPDAVRIRLLFNRQSPDIDLGVSQGVVIGAGDQGMMFGYACDETPSLMPLPLTLAHGLVARLAEARESGRLPWLRPDAKSQVTVRYTGGRPAGVETVVISTQHAAEVGQVEIAAAVRAEVVDAVVPPALRAPGFRCLVNPTGRFVVGGPKGDTGLTGRKIIVDTYGGSCPHGGGAFSGKDPTKVDRSGAYLARHLAKHVVAAGAARRCTVQLAYAIGVAVPVSLLVDTHGTGAVPDARIARGLTALFDLTPGGIIAALDLRRPVYRPTAAYGHFGRDGFTWEATPKAGELAAALGLAGVRTDAKTRRPDAARARKS